MVDTGDLKSPALLPGHAGSIPAGGTKDERLRIYIQTFRLAAFITSSERGIHMKPMTCICILNNLIYINIWMFH